MSQVSVFARPDGGVGVGHFFRPKFGTDSTKEDNFGIKCCKCAARLRVVVVFVQQPIGRCANATTSAAKTQHRCCANATTTGSDAARTQHAAQAQRMCCGCANLCWTFATSNRRNVAIVQRFVTIV